MITIDAFPIVRLLGDDPMPGRVLLNAPRPLEGALVDVDVMGFTVNVADADGWVLDYNHRMDAVHLTWTTHADAIAEIRDEDLLATWRARNAGRSMP
jgi:hypothetical protein